VVAHDVSDLELISASVTTLATGGESSNIGKAVIALSPDADGELF
jgi:hypothetical protein